MWCHWTPSWEAIWTTASEKLLWTECPFWDVISPWLLHHEIPCFIFYYSDTRFSPSLYCSYFLFVIPNCRLNWRLNFPSLHFLPWHFPPLSCFHHHFSMNDAKLLAAPWRSYLYSNILLKLGILPPSPHMQ